MPSNQWVNLRRNRWSQISKENNQIKINGSCCDYSNILPSYLLSPNSNLPGPFLRKLPVIQQGISPLITVLMGSGVSSTVLTRGPMNSRPLADGRFLSAEKKSHHNNQCDGWLDCTEFLRTSELKRNSWYLMLIINWMKLTKKEKISKCCKSKLKLLLIISSVCAVLKR